MKFAVEAPDYGASPYTGMTKKHWIDACHFLLDGIFQHIKTLDDPILLPRHEYAVSYPQPEGPLWRLAAEKFEGLARSFLIAAPLLANEPDAEAAGIPLAAYYKRQILLSVTPGSANYLYGIQEILPQGQPGEKAFQHTAECASLAIGLSMCPEAVWETYTKEEKDRIAAYLSQFGHSYTGHHNWRLFNMLILAFLDREGYVIDRDMMRDHAQVIVSYYAGDGWYRDGHLFDYYCPWAFHVYGPLWNQWYGYEKEPWLAGKIEEYANRLAETFPQFFDREAHVTMWGRSSIYRSAASAPLAADFLLKKHTADPGLARRIASGALLQFITREECFYEGALCLGFYGPFAPLIQTYSCAASPMWIANAFVCLVLPDDHPFWTARENNGVWEAGGEGCRLLEAGGAACCAEAEPVSAPVSGGAVFCPDSRTVTTCLPGPGIAADNHLATGITELRTAKVLMEKQYASRNAYLRLAFNSQFPWEDFDGRGAEAMQYSLTKAQGGPSQVPNILMYAGEKDGVLYRKEYFDFEHTFQDKCSIDLADFPVACGHVRVDKVRIPDKPYILTLGAFGMPDTGDVRREERVSPDGTARAVILSSSWGQVALTIYGGFENIAEKERTGVNPAAERSRLLYGVSRRDGWYAYRPYVMVSAVLTKRGGESWTDEELFPICSIAYTDPEGCGGYGPVTLCLKDGRTVTVDYEGMEGRLMI